MNADQIIIAQSCLHGAHDGTLSFLEIVGALIAAGFEGYTVDYRSGTQSYYLPSGESLVLEMPDRAGAVAASFDAKEIERLVRWAQTNPADYSYAAFSERAKSAGCAGYIVSFSGRRVVYLGRTAETHVEHFPS